MIPASLPTSVDLRKAILQKIQGTLFDKKTITLEVLRTDLIHPIISGNKWFKLKYHLEAAKELNNKGIISFGGAYSNHLLAVAHACQSEGLKSVAIVRGEEPALLSPTLIQIQNFGMDLHFISREQYKNKSQVQQQLAAQYKDYYWVNEGGQSSLGVKGASEIMELVPGNDYSHILCAVGTGTMMAGLMNAAKPSQQVCGIPIFTINDQNNNTLLSFLHQQSHHPAFSLHYGFQEGGYAKKTDSLLRFMNDLYQHHQVPTDFVYTGKLFKAVFELTERGFFPIGSKLLVIHSGGLQGNRSLPAGSLTFPS